MDPRVRRRRLRIIFGSFLAAAVAAVLVFFLAPATGFSSGALLHSVGREAGTGAYFDDECDRHFKGGWSCEVAAKNGSGSYNYRVRITDGRCWKARRSAGYGAKLPRELSGCLKMRDQLRPLDRLGDLLGL